MKRFWLINLGENELIRTILSRTESPAKNVTKEGYVVFRYVMKSLGDKHQANMTNAQIDEFVKALDG